MNHAGAFALGSALAYLLCTVEIVEQTAALGVQATHLYMTSGNKGHAGLVIGPEAARAVVPDDRDLAAARRRPRARRPGRRPRCRPDARLGRAARRERRRELRRVRRRGLRRADAGGAGRDQAGRPHRRAAARPGLHRQGDGRPDRPRPARPARARTTSWCSSTPAGCRPCSPSRTRSWPASTPDPNTHAGRTLASIKRQDMHCVEAGLTLSPYHGRRLEGRHMPWHRLHAKTSLRSRSSG